MLSFNYETAFLYTKSFVTVQLKMIKEMNSKDRFIILHISECIHVSVCVCMCTYKGAVTLGIMV